MCWENHVLTHIISPNMWTYSQKNHCFVLFVLAETILAFFDRPAFFADNKNYPKISIYPRTTATA